MRCRAISFIVWSTLVWNVLTADQLEYRIQNGFIASPGEFPSVVLLTGKQHRCTGTLVGPNKILTAGHCACGDTMTDAYANVTSVSERFDPTAYHRRILGIAYPVSYAQSCEQLFHGNDQYQNVLGGTSDIAILTTDDPFPYIPGAVEFEQLDLSSESNFSKLLNEVVQADALVLGFGKEAHSQTTGVLRFGKPHWTPSVDLFYTFFPYVHRYSSGNIRFTLNRPLSPPMSGGLYISISLPPLQREGELAGKNVY
ncbi:unnamed protein product [Echinostoma caproni]|uniref:Peptidase S1 domain-containing protein n=1 Tax=Echinostoma caproni TaxID=27848 RepID=A0A182ZZ80_9TREM|nr:unnamed protein product [Echinostoma caproni]